MVRDSKNQAGEVRGGFTRTVVPERVDASPSSYRNVETANGRLRGAVYQGIASFKGVHYGAPTHGINRFRPPQAVKPWTGVRDAVELGPQSPQINRDLPGWLDASEQDEDCLVLNVWAPAHAGPDSRLPVVVWLHGGAFVYGSAGAPLYDGGNMARDGEVIVVGVNHRLNIFGYTYLGDHADERFAQSGNVGQLDIVAALEWVRENISVFGGDSGNVTLLGQSGGGGKITALMAMEVAKGLFHKAIVMSGSLLRFATAVEAGHVARSLYRELRLREGNVEALQAVPAKVLVDYLKVLGNPPEPGSLNPRLSFRPVLDGHVLKGQHWISAAPASARNIPMIIGSNLHETVDRLNDGLDVSALNDRDFARRIAAAAVINIVQPEEIARVVALYRNAMPPLSHEELAIRISTDVGFWNNAVRQSAAKAELGGAPVFAYECQWKTPCFGQSYALHGVELPFVFRRQNYGSAWDGQDSDAARAAADPNRDRFRVGDQMFEAWMEFARSGTPSTSGLEWPAYDTQTRQTMVFDAHTRVVQDLRGDVWPAVAALAIS